MCGEVIIATCNRKNELQTCLNHIENGTVYPNRIIIIDASDSSDFKYNGKLNIEFVVCPPNKKGSTMQRNMGLDKISTETEVVTFLDDDFYVDRYYFENMYHAFECDPLLVGAEGALTRDGKTVCSLPEENKVVDSLYGCNMSFRKSTIGKIRFDEKLKLYAFKED